MAKGSNNRMRKQVNDVKGEPEKRQVEIARGNIDILTVQLLNSINEKLTNIEELLKNG